MANIDFNNLDPDAVKLAQAIRQTETGGNFTKSNPDAGGWSVGAYQWHGKNETAARQHFASEATQFGLDPHDFSPVNQDKVAYAKIKNWKDEGYHAGEIAALWNGAHMVHGRPQAINPNYVAKVQKNLGSVPGVQVKTQGFNAAPFSSGAVNLGQPSKPEDLPTGVMNAVGGFGTGVFKGVGQDLEDTGGKIGDAVSRLLHLKGAQGNGPTAGGKIATQQFTPQGNAEKVGKVAGQAVPAAALAATGAGAAADAAGIDVPATAEALGKSGLPSKLAKGGGMLTEAYGLYQLLKRSPLKGLLTGLAKFL